MAGAVTDQDQVDKNLQTLFKLGRIKYHYLLLVETVAFKGTQSPHLHFRNFKSITKKTDPSTDSRIKESNLTILPNKPPFRNTLAPTCNVQKTIPFKGCSGAAPNCIFKWGIIIWKAYKSPGHSTGMRGVRTSDGSVVEWQDDVRPFNDVTPPSSARQEMAPPQTLKRGSRSNWID